MANADKTVIDDTTKADLEGIYDEVIATGTSVDPRIEREMQSARTPGRLPSLVKCGAGGGGLLLLPNGWCDEPRDRGRSRSPQEGGEVHPSAEE